VNFTTFDPSIAIKLFVCSTYDRPSFAKLYANYTFSSVEEASASCFEDPENTDPTYQPGDKQVALHLGWLLNVAKSSEVFRIVSN